MELTADVIAIAFNQENERKTWQARPNNRDSAETVHFSAQTGMIALIYNVRNRTWHVRFNKFQTSWGDYIRSISRALYIVLTTLKQAGLPFDAPDAPEGIEIVCQASPDADTLVRYVPPAEPVNPFGHNLQHESRLHRLGGPPPLVEFLGMPVVIADGSDAHMKALSDAVLTGAGAILANDDGTFHHVPAKEIQATALQVMKDLTPPDDTN